MTSTTDTVKELAEKLSQAETEQETIRAGVQALTERVEKTSIVSSEKKGLFISKEKTNFKYFEL